MFCWCSLCFSIRLGRFLGRSLRSLVLKGFTSAQSLVHSSGLVRICSLQPVSNKTVIAFWLALLWLPILLLAAIATPEQLLNWPAMFAIGVFFIPLMLGPFAATPWLLKKVAKVAISIFFLKGLWFLLRSKPLWVFLAPFGLTRSYAGFVLMMAGHCRMVHFRSSGDLLSRASAAG